MPETLSAPPPPPRERYRLRSVPVLATLVVVLIASAVTYLAWQAYLGTPWTRDGTVRVYVVRLAPEVSGRVVALPVVDNQMVRKGDLLMQIDRQDYEIAVRLAEASVAQAQADATNKRVQAQRRSRLSDLAVTAEEQQTYVASAGIADAVYQAALANLEKARLNLARTELRAPTDGWVTNLQTQLGDYATAGGRTMSLVDADSFWVDGYFEETKLGAIEPGDAARVWLLGYRQVVSGRVESIARGITVANAEAGASGLATVNPIFTWVRLAQRIPVRIRIDAPPAGVRLVAGMTATVEIVPGSRPAAD